MWLIYYIVYSVQVNIKWWYWPPLILCATIMPEHEVSVKSTHLTLPTGGRYGSLEKKMSSVKKIIGTFDGENENGTTVSRFLWTGETGGEKFSLVTFGPPVVGSKRGRTVLSSRWGNTSCSWRAEGVVRRCPQSLIFLKRCECVGGDSTLPAWNRNFTRWEWKSRPGCTRSPRLMDQSQLLKKNWLARASRFCTRF